MEKKNTFAIYTKFYDMYDIVDKYHRIEEFDNLHMAKERVRQLNDWYKQYTESYGKNESGIEQFYTDLFEDENFVGGNDKYPPFVVGDIELTERTTTGDFYESWYEVILEDSKDVKRYAFYVYDPNYSAYQRIAQFYSLEEAEKKSKQIYEFYKQYTDSNGENTFGIEPFVIDMFDYITRCIRTCFIDKDYIIHSETMESPMRDLFKAGKIVNTETKDNYSAMDSLGNDLWKNVFK